MTKESNENNKPVKKFRLRGISASVFENQTEKGQTFYKVTLSRSYKDSKGGFKSTNTFSRDDLPLLTEVANAAWRDILKREAEATASESKDDE
ncbi:MAG: hypothetical protein WBD31_30530 [Rubripirellula sp.]